VGGSANDALNQHQQNAGRLVSRNTVNSIERILREVVSPKSG